MVRDDYKINTLEGTRLDVETLYKLKKKCLLLQLRLISIH